MTVEEKKAYERIQKKLIRHRTYVVRRRLLERLLVSFALVFLMMMGWVVGKMSPTELRPVPVVRTIFELATSTPSGETSSAQVEPEQAISTVSSSILYEQVFFPEDGDWFYSIGTPRTPPVTLPLRPNRMVGKDDGVTIDTHVIWIHLEGRSSAHLIRWAARDSR
ncbi:MAG: hypothetical protein BSOLF_2019 [Candidatus Carbobacillus altaicus]|uniref:Uncharacterized protein n=1 Tax=Candidatus Carbonibacillus altaicus TaxID=2163959 RepID=A0A2R6Y3I9_9BACL|nr:MAG: hypothetical protein BSOLF_2019 [Candidatus Carbobacillus altaicus]